MQMLYRSSVTGTYYKALDGAVPIICSQGTVKLVVGDHSMNFINLKVFEDMLDNGQIPFYKVSYEHVADSFLDKEFK